MTDNGIINIHGKEYMTVARRVELAHEKGRLEHVESEVLSHTPSVVIRAKVTVIHGAGREEHHTYTGISAVSLTTVKQIEKQNPYEVAETSAVGRALGFAGFGIIEGIPSADEMHKAGLGGFEKDMADDHARAAAKKESVAEELERKTAPLTGEERLMEESLAETTVSETKKCWKCGAPATFRQGTSKTGKPYRVFFCSTDDKTHAEFL